MNGMMTSWALSAVGACALSVATAAGDPEPARGITPEQVLRLRVVTGVYPSPDGKTIAFLRSEPRTEGQSPGPDHVHLWSIHRDGSGERRLLGGERRVHGVAWRPGGRQLTFIDRREGDEHPEVWALPVDGGEPVRLTTSGTGVLAYRWRPDGRALAYTSTDEPPPGRRAARERGYRVQVVDEIWDHRSLWVLEEGASEAARITEGVTVRSFEWAPDGRRIAAGISPRPLVDDGYMFTRLHCIDPAARRVERLVDNPGKLGDFAWSPDGKSVAYVTAADRRDPHAGMLAVVEVATGASRSLTGDFAGMVHEVHWRVPDRILAVVSRSVVTQAIEIDVASGGRRDVTPPGPAFRHIAALPGADGLVAPGSTAAHPAEVMVYEGDWQRRTRSNPWLDDVALGRQETVTITTRDAWRIQGLLLYPVAYRPGDRYPLVIVVHGGPESHFDDGWNTSYSRWGQLLCARGYFAWYPNYRSSTGRGVAFAKADHGDPMGKEFEDHLDAIRELTDRGLIDPGRVGMGGGSYGGYTSAWAATRHTEHFAAAVSFVPFVDIRTKWYTSDIPWEFYHVHYEEKWPHEQPEFLGSRSPLTFAPRCRTPLLLLGGTSDTRVHPSQPFMLYRAVRTATSTPVRYVQYPGEGHGNRVDVYRHDYCVRSLRWFDHYLLPGDHRDRSPPPPDVEYPSWRRPAERGGLSSGRPPEARDEP